MKKGAVQIQFNWIFILIAGTLILALVVGFVFRWMANSERQDATETLRNLETIITASGVVEGESKRLDIPKTELEFDGSNLKFKGVGIPGTTINSLFAPARIKGNALIIWTDSWFIPFYVGNMVYITSPEVRYIAVYNASTNSMRLKDYLLEQIPPIVNINYIDESQYSLLKDENNYFTVVAFLELPRKPPLSFKGDQTCIEVKRETEISGSFDFYEKHGSGWDFKGNHTWFNPTLIGGIATGEHWLYNSSFENHLERLEIVSSLLLHKLHQMLLSDPTETTYLSFETTLEEMYQMVANREFFGLIDKVKLMVRQNKILALEGKAQVY